MTRRGPRPRYADCRRCGGLLYVRGPAALWHHKANRGLACPPARTFLDELRMPHGRPANLRRHP